MSRCPNCVRPDCDALDTDLYLATAIASRVDRAVKDGERAAKRPPDESPYQIPASVSARPLRLVTS